MKQQTLFFKPSIYATFLCVTISCNSAKRLQQESGGTSHKSTTTESNIQAKFTEGIEFYGTGSDWMISLDVDNDFVFKKVDGFIFSTPAVEAVKAQDANVSRYRAQVESGEMIIQLYKQECINESTGQKFPYRVTVEIRRGIDKEFQNFEGCGQFTFDERIHDIWVLQKMNDIEISGTNLPYVEINTTEGKIVGQTGCNNISGKASFKGNTLTLGPLAASRKFCPNAPYESDFLKALSPGVIDYTIDNKKLVLSRGGKEIMVFKKVD